jgi:hypothetical protein
VFPRHTHAAGAGSAAFGGSNYGSISTYVGTLEGTALHVAKQDVHLAAVADFTGREWLFDEFAEFRAAGRSGYFLVEAAAGLGKTSFAARLASHRHHYGHFTKLEGGAHRRSALLNLSAQLIIDLDLFPDIEREFFLPDMDRTRVPEWAGQPEYFAKLLRLAAAKATARGHPLVLVVDGLDEEEPLSTPVPLGLPVELPDGVHVVATMRTGTLITLASTESRVVRIVADDRRNLQDMHDYLVKVAARTDVTTLLADRGITADDFARRLTDRCGGVWIYLRYLLPTVRTGDVDLDHLDRLPSQLAHYFAHSFARWRVETSWPEIDLPILGVLGAAGEPITAPQIGAIAGVTPAVAQTVCDRRYGAFLHVYRDGHRARKYSVYHRSFGEFLAVPAEDEVLLRAVEDLRDQLADQVLIAHGDLAEHYLDAFRTSPEDFPRLHSGYGLRHLPTHLAAAERHVTLRALLLPTSGWLAAQAGYGDLNAYTQDVITQMRLAAGLVDSAATLRADLEPMRFEVSATLFLAGRTAEPGDVPVDLVGPLIRNGVWTAHDAVDRVKTVTNPRLFAVGLLGALPHLPADMRAACFRLVDAAAGAVPTVEDRVFIDLRRAAASTPEQHGHLWQWAVDMLAEVREPSQRLEGLVEAALSAPTRADEEALADEALDAARRIDVGAENPIPGLHLGQIRTSTSVTLLPYVRADHRDALAAEIVAAPVPEGAPGVLHLAALARYSDDTATRDRLLRGALTRARAIPDIRAVAAMMQVIAEVLANG